MLMRVPEHRFVQARTHAARIDVNRHSAASRRALCANAWATPAQSRDDVFNSWEQ
jgi:hypothetical protein